MRESNEFNELLERHKLKKTGPRLSVLEILKSKDSAVSQPDLEKILGKQVDRVTLYRTLSTFEDKGIIHKVLDFNGTANYAFCSGGCKEHEHHDEHVHFNCTVCQSIYCLDKVIIPPINLPAGFEASSLHFTIYGVCDNCKN